MIESKETFSTLAARWLFRASFKQKDTILKSRWYYAVDAMVLVPGRANRRFRFVTRISPRVIRDVLHERSLSRFGATKKRVTYSHSIMNKIIIRPLWFYYMIGERFRWFHRFIVNRMVLLYISIYLFRWLHAYIYVREYTTTTSNTEHTHIGAGSTLSLYYRVDNGRSISRLYARRFGLASHISDR